MNILEVNLTATVELYPEDLTVLAFVCQAMRDGVLSDGAEIIGLYASTFEALAVACHKDGYVIISAMDDASLTAMREEAMPVFRRWLPGWGADIQRPWLRRPDAGEAAK